MKIYLNDELKMETSSPETFICDGVKGCSDVQFFLNLWNNPQFAEFATGYKELRYDINADTYTVIK